MIFKLNIKVMKRSVLIVGIMGIVMLSTADLIAQRNGRNSSRNDNRGKEIKDRKSGNKKMNRGNDRQVSVVNRNTVRYNGYRGSSYKRFGTNRVHNRRDVRRTIRPTSRHIWIVGQRRYNSTLRRDVWYDGHWVVQQRIHQWIPGHYTRYGSARVWVSGYWAIN